MLSSLCLLCVLSRFFFLQKKELIWPKAPWRCGGSSPWTLSLWPPSVSPHSLTLKCFSSQTHGVCLVHILGLFWSRQCISQRWSSVWASRWPAIESTCTRPSTRRYGELAGIIVCYYPTLKPGYDTWRSPFSSVGHQGRSTRFSTRGWSSTWWWLCWWGWPGSSSPPDLRQTTLRVREGTVCVKYCFIVNL